VNNLNNFYLASQYQAPAGTGNNGIANAVAAGCKGVGCHIVVDPGYGNTEFPQGYQTADWGFPWPMQTSVEDHRNGILNLAFHDPASSAPQQMQAAKKLSIWFLTSTLEWTTRKTPLAAFRCMHMVGSM
jgi:hypothetical protein